MAGQRPKRPVNLSISEEVLRGARRHGINLSEVAEQAVRREVDRRDRETLQERMHRTMAMWNNFYPETPSVADEFGTL